MSDRDARVEAAARALWRANRRDGKPQTYPYDRLIEPTREDLLGLARAALAAADAVQGDVTNSPALTEAYLKGLAAGRSEPADDRRMVDRITAWLRECADNAILDEAERYFRNAADAVEREFGGSAPSTDQP